MSNALSDSVWVLVCRPHVSGQTGYLLDKERGILESRARHERHCCRQFSPRIIRKMENVSAQHSNVQTRLVVIGDEIQQHGLPTYCLLSATSSHLAQCKNGRNQLFERSTPVPNVKLRKKKMMALRWLPGKLAAQFTGHSWALLLPGDSFQSAEWLL